MGATTDLRREIKKAFVPFVQERGFVMSNRHAPNIIEFRRQAASGIHVFDIQWEKYGRPRFVINFGICPTEGITVHGQHFPAAEVATGWLPENGRLQPGRGTSSRSWFRQDKPLLQRVLSREGLYPAAQVIAGLIQLFPEIERYWSSGAAGPHLRVFKIPV